jgi:hypothetical protein
MLGRPGTGLWVNREVRGFKGLRNLDENWLLENKHINVSTSLILGQPTPILKNKHVNLDTKRTLYNTIFIPSLCYQCQTWTLTAQEKRKITTTEMSCQKDLEHHKKRQNLKRRDNKTRGDTSLRLHHKTTDQMVWTHNTHVAKQHPA